MAGDDHDFSRELADLVTRPADEGLGPAPYSKRRAFARADTVIADGYRRYQAGSFSVEVSPWGLISVRQRDWLSKFAQAIHGDTFVEGRFARILGNDLVPVANEDFIETGEVLVHLPTFQARRAEEEGFKLIIDGREIAVPKGENRDPAKSVQEMLEREARRREAAAGEAGDMSAARMRAEGIDHALTEGGSFEKIAGQAAAGAAKGASIAAIRTILDRWLADAPDLTTLTEEDKQAIFFVDERKTTQILYYEFLSGTGKPVRDFDDSHAITGTIRHGQIGTAIREDIAARRRLAGDRAAPATSTGGRDLVLDLLDFGSFDGHFNFSPDQTMADASSDGWLDQLAGAGQSALAHARAGARFAVGQPIEFFIGGCVYHVDTADSRLGPTGVEYGVTVTNETSLTSLFAHARTVKNVPRDSEFDVALRGEAETLPYSSIKQIFHLYLAPAIP